MFEDLLDFVNEVMRDARDISDISKIEGQQAICWMLWDPSVKAKVQNEVRSLSV